MSHGKRATCWEHLGRKVTQLTARRQVAVDEEIGDLEEGRLFGELFDGVAAVAEDAGGSVDLCAASEEVYISCA